MTETRIEKLDGKTAGSGRQKLCRGKHLAAGLEPRPSQIHAVIGIEGPWNK